MRFLVSWVIITTILFFASGIVIGMLIQQGTHQRTLTEWGCAGYEYSTGEWTLNYGGTCRIPLPEILEP